MHYYTDYNELEALRVENIKLKQEINILTDEIIKLKHKNKKSDGGNS